MPTRDSAKTLSKCLRVGLALAALVAAVLCALTSTPAEAKSSGGYSRPSFSGSSRSFSSGSSHSGGSSSYSGGSSYVRPPMSAPRTVFPSSAGDRTISRQSSEQALKRFQEDRPSAPSYEPPRRPSLTPSREEAPIGYARRPSLEPSYRPPPSSSGWGWSPPPNVSPSASSYNGWNPFLFWFLLDRLADSGNARFFHNHEYDPGYAQWRAEADRRARSDADLRAKLDDLDAKLAAQQSDPRDPHYLPSGVTPESAHASAQINEASETSSNGGGGRGLFLVAVILVGGIVFLFYVNGRHAAAAASYADISGTAKGKPMKELQIAANLLRQKLSGAPLQLKPFRVGMALTLDPTPFILARDTVKVPAPRTEGTTSFVSVRTIGRLEGVPLSRLYTGDDTFVQLHLDGNTPDECRYFGQIDEIAPADADEWKAWLEPGEGMIGWPQFQTKDGKLYDRVWSPGTSWIEPPRYVERREGADTSEVSGVMMLYGAATGVADPAPQFEYILVSSVEWEGGGAFVAIHAGIDVNPAGLSLT